MARTFLERLHAGEVLVADGATGTNLQAAGVKPGAPPEDLVFDAPDTILNLQRAFVEAGSDIILTDTFGATRLRLRESKYAERVQDVNRRAVELARKAASAHEGVLVAGSMGPTGALMQPYGPLTSEEAIAVYAEQAQALTDAGVDLLLVETMFALDEATAAVQGARQVSTLPIVISFSYDRGVRTMMGVKPAQVVETFKPMGVVAVGANCGTTLDNMEKLVKDYAAFNSGLPIWAKPNAGLPLVEDGQSVYEVTPEQLAEYAARYVQAGARIVGGCCGSTPAHIAAMAKAVKGSGSR